MNYDIQLGLLATQALTDLLLAVAGDDETRYRGFLLKSAEFCRSIRESEPSAALPQATSQAAVAFISTVMKVSEERSSVHEKSRFVSIQKIEPLIGRVLEENRRPNRDEQVQIAEVLYSASGADFR